MANCLMVYDWKECEKVDWLLIFDELLGELGLKPGKALCVTSSTRSYGQYQRVKGRIKKLLSEMSSFSIRVDSEETNQDDDFFPSDLRFVVNEFDQARKSAMIAVRGRVIGADLADAASKLFRYMGPCYGGELKFPANFGPDCYLSSVIAAPRCFEDEGRLSSYGDRLIMWRDRLAAGYRPRDGYFREVYGINYVTIKHLAMPFRGKSLEAFMNESGRLEQVPHIPGLFQWQVRKSSLEGIRLAMESSGLVLSSDFEPISPFV